MVLVVARLLRGIGGNRGAQHPPSGGINTEGAHQGLNMPIATGMGHKHTKYETGKYMLMFCKDHQPAEMVQPDTPPKSILLGP